MATDAEFSAIVKVLNQVQTAGQARVAAGAALNAVHVAYDLLDDLTADRARAGKGELDAARVALETWYANIKGVSGAAPFANEWATKGRKLVERCYIAVAGVEGQAKHVPQTSNLQILATSLAEAPAVFTQAVGKAAGTVAKEAGSVVGSAAGGILSGLGISGTLTMVVIGLGVFAFYRRASLPALLGRLLGGGGA